jgi:serine/threonine protein kinase
MPTVYKPNDEVDGYRILTPIGVGGMGVVYSVVRTSDGAGLALKCCSTEDDESRRRFGREVRVMEKITSDNVMPVLAKNLDCDVPYYVMPRADGNVGDELAALAADHARAIETFAQICAGVEAIHAAGATHRDIKPHNALRFADARVVVSDLGLARLEVRDTTVLTRVQTTMGTDRYLPPEARTDGGFRDATFAFDIFSLGLLLHDLLTGAEFGVCDLERVERRLAGVIQCAMQPRAADRFASVRDLREAAVEAARRKPTPAPSRRRAGDEVPPAAPLRASNQSMAVYQIAEALGMDSDAVVAKIRASGIPVNNKMSKLQGDVAEQIKSSLLKEQQQDWVEIDLGNGVKKRVRRGPPGQPA